MHSEYQLKGVKMKFVILFIFFTILSIWFLVGGSSIYMDIFVYQNFMEKVWRTEWYYLLAGVFFTGMPLWLTTIYFLFRKWKTGSIITDIEVFYLFGAYFFFTIMLISHMTRPFFWGTMLALHILFLILLIRTK